ncbi:hypothetical protein mRhiFer1_009971 [Rhinolophus ferrumequinum]|uniref:Uncharacterized protein n=1 Tax=Rhinolophus ferrumequinum TaxID=59479 RepID=A0A7J7YIQ9_RHIFE|nr:hypothetical protein mRhiFer1_009971 [Rhinolophus ferrumequinum]
MAALNTLEERMDLSGEKKENLLGIKENIMKSSTRASSPTKEHSKEKDATKTWSKKDVAGRKPDGGAVLPKGAAALGLPPALQPALAPTLPPIATAPAALRLSESFLAQTGLQDTFPLQIKPLKRDEKERKRGTLLLYPPTPTGRLTRNMTRNTSWRCSPPVENLNVWHSYRKDTPLINPKARCGL